MLIDSNVLIAAAVVGHLHHEPSTTLLETAPRLAIAGHSYAETFVQLTRRGPSAPAGFTSDEAWAAIRALTAGMRTVGLSPLQTVEGVQRFAADGGIGARLYDYLIGRAAAEAGISRVVTWNVRHLRPLFPELEILTPDQAMA